MRNAAPIWSSHPSPIFCGQNLLDTQFPAPYTLNYQKEVLINSTYDEKGHGLFTYFILKGFKNEDVISPDCALRMDDLYGYLNPQVGRERYTAHFINDGLRWEF